MEMLLCLCVCWFRAYFFFRRQIVDYVYLRKKNLSRESINMCIRILWAHECKGKNAERVRPTTNRRSHTLETVARKSSAKKKEEWTTNGFSMHSPCVINVFVRVCVFVCYIPSNFLFFCRFPFSFLDEKSQMQHSAHNRIQHLLTGICYMSIA